MPKIVKAVVVSLLIEAASCAALGAHAGPLIDEAFVLSVEEFMSRSLLSVAAPKLPPAQVVVALRYPPPESRRTRFHPWSGCGWGSAVYPAPRMTKLPVNPIFILVAGYRQCRRIVATMIEPRVPVGLYPAGHFGDFIYEGLLVSDRLEFSDEPTLQQVFGLLAETAEEPESDWAWYFEGWDDPELKLVEYRNKTRFTPELLLEFVGETTVRIELNLTTRRLLVQTGERWEMYTLDQRSGAALQNLVTAEQTRRRQAEASQTGF